MTEALCLAGLTEVDIGHLCTRFANALAKPSKSGVLSTFMPMCADICFHSCAATSAQDRDGFQDCRDPSCADSTCADFLIR